MSSREASSIRPSASGGPSIRTVSGSSSSSARSSERAEPGPWWRIPKTVCVTAPGRRGRARPSRRARAPPPPGTPARSPCPGPGPARPRRSGRPRGPRATATPSPKWVASASPLVTTLIASAVESVPDGDLIFVRPSSVTPARSSRKIVTTRRISSSAEVAGGSSSVAPTASRRSRTISTSSSALSGSGQHDGVEAPPHGARQVVDAAVAVVGGGDHVEALDGLDLLVELGDRERLLGQDRDQRVLHVGRDPRQLLDARELARAPSPGSTGPGTSASRDGPSASSRA